MVKMELNPKIFDQDGQMFPEVREKLIEIVDEFMASMEDTEIGWNPLDVVVVGSNAGYNYTDRSDLDLHIVVDLREISETCPELLSQLFNAERRLFNQDYDLTIKGINVEIYVEDINAGTRTNGIYSVLSDDWIVKPIEVETPKLDLSDPDYQETFSLVTDTLHNGTSDEVEMVINSLYLTRKYSLAQDGESGKGNLIFKEIRNSGLLDKLKERKLELRSKELSLESMKGKKIEVEGQWA